MIDLEYLKTHLGLSPATSQDEAALQQSIDAANALAREHRPDVTATDDWPDQIDKGAGLMAARAYGRRGSVLGAAMFADVAVITMGPIDPDVAFMWGLGIYQKSVVA